MDEFVDVDHGSNIVTRRSHTGYLLYITHALVALFGRKQNTVEPAPMAQNS